MQTNYEPVSRDTQTDQPWLSRPLRFGQTPATLILLAIMLLSTALHLNNIAAIGDSNTYYSAAVKSMLQSWQNFFFAVAEPGGSVTVDKPPLGLWVETAFAWALGVSGFTTALPNILAGIFSVPLLYRLVKKQLSAQAGLLAALALAVTPVVLATDRNNTADGLLTFTLLLAAWTFFKASETNQLRYLLLGALVVGLGFNIKMLQALLPLPAFYALYFFSARAGWWRKTWQLAITSLVLAIVSLSWAVVVDSIPADERPYIGSSESNSVLELALGYNGLARLLGPGAVNHPTQPPAEGIFPQPRSGAIQPGLPSTEQPNHQGGVPGGQLPARSFGSPGGAPGGQGGTPFSAEVGSPGVLRFFQVPLGKEMSWLLPLALAGLLLAAVQGRLSLPIQDEQHKAFLLWGGWLVTCLVFFSVARFFHAYYLVMLAPALGGLLGLGLAGLARVSQSRPHLAAVLLTGSATLTVAFQIYLARSLGVWEWWLGLAVILLALGAGVFCITLLRQEHRPAWLRVGGSITLAALLLTPLVWSYLTVSDAQQDVNLPGAYSRQQQQGIFQSAPGNRPVPAPQGTQAGRALNTVDAGLLTFLQENTQGNKYLLAVPNAHTGAGYVLATGRPVLYMGGFSGSDPVVNAETLAKLVQVGDLRYIYYMPKPAQEHGGISRWLQVNCSIVGGFSHVAFAQQPARGNLQAPLPPGSLGLTLYDCASSP